MIGITECDQATPTFFTANFVYSQFFKVPHLEGTIDTYLEQEIKRDGTTFKSTFVDSKYPQIPQQDAKKSN